MADLSKIKIGETVYNLKDADSRGKLTTLLGSHAVEVLGAAAWLGADAEVTGGATGVATTAAVKSYVDAQVGTIHNFDVRVYDSLPTASADTMYILALVADSHATGDIYDEFITVRSGAASSYTYAWEKIGNTDIDLSGYVQKTTTIAGVDLQDDITATELKGALGLGAMAEADTASGEVGGQTITGITASYTPAGTVSAPTITVTPATDTVKVTKTTGSVSAGSAATISEGFFNAGALPTKANDQFTAGSFTQGNDSFTANVPTAIDTTKFSGGSKAADTFDAGALPTKANDTFTAATLGTATTNNFATAGITASVDSEDTEMLVFTAASTSAAVTGYPSFNGGSFTEGAFTQGSLPSFTEGTFTPASIAAGFVTPGTAATYTQGTDTFVAPTFEEGAFAQGSLPSIDATKFNGGTPTAVTLPTFEDATVVTGITSATASQPEFTGTAGTANVGDITITAKTVTVTPDAE